MPLQPGLVGLHRDSANFVVDLRGDSGRDYHLRALIVDILGVVGVKLAVEDDFTAGAGLRVVVTQHRTLNFPPFNALLHHHFMVKFEGGATA